jgi:IS30 family transposase
LSFVEREDIAIWDALKVSAREIARRLRRAGNRVGRQQYAGPRRQPAPSAQTHRQAERSASRTRTMPYGCGDSRRP